MKIYLAGRFSNKKKLQRERDFLEELGHEVTSRWLDGDSGSMVDTAQMDLDDIDSCDAIVLWADDPKQDERPMQGALVELGYAIAKGKLLFVLNQLRNKCIFFYLPQVIEVAGWTDLVQRLEEHSNRIEHER